MVNSTELTSSEKAELLRKHSLFHWFCCYTCYYEQWATIPTKPVMVVFSLKIMI